MKSRESIINSAAHQARYSMCPVGNAAALKILASHFAWAHTFLGVRVDWAKFFSWTGGEHVRRFLRRAGMKMLGFLDEQRRAQRLPIYLPVQVYGKLEGAPFYENTETINVSAYGGLVPISAAVVRAQELILTNLQTDQDLTCRVARLIRSERGQVLAGLEFLQSAPGFWRSSTSPIEFAHSIPGKHPRYFR
jgi:hypothetical protein